MKRIISLIATLALLFVFALPVSAHSGRTDSSGGHKDNQNRSGLGSYHYHHGYGPHLHPNGICEYSPKDSIVVSNMPNNVQIGDSVPLEWEVTYYSGSGSVTWSSSDPSILRVSNSGVLEAIGIGSASITATMSNGSRTFTVTVLPIYPEEIEIDGLIEDLEVEQSHQITATILPKNATDKTITWSSSNTEIAQVDNTGTISGIAPGTAVITAAAHNNIRVDFPINVFEILPEDIVLSESTISLPLNTELTVQASVIPENVTRGTLTWASADESIATIKDGLLSGVGEGTTTITASFQNLTKEITVTVYEVKAESIAVSPEPLRISLGEEQVMEASLTPDNITFPDVSWEVADESLVALEGTTITALAVGQTELAARCQDAFVVVPIEVYSIPIESIRFENPNSFFKNSYQLLYGEEITPEIEILPKDASYQDVIYRSGDDNILRVQGTTLIAVGTGKTMLFVTAGDKTVEIPVVISNGKISIFTVVLIALGFSGIVVGVVFLFKKKRQKTSRQNPS